MNFTDKISFLNATGWWITLLLGSLLNVYILYSQRDNLNFGLFCFILIPQLFVLFLFTSTLEVQYTEKEIVYTFSPLIIKPRKIALSEIKKVSWTPKVSFFSGKGMRSNGKKTAFILQDYPLLTFELQSGKEIAFSVSDEKMAKKYMDYLNNHEKN